MKYIPTKTTYLEMYQPRMPPISVPRDGLTVDHLANPSVEEYRRLYNGVGSGYNWVDRNLMSADELRKVLHDDAISIYLLRVNGEAAGYSELDRRQPHEIELAYFGLFPQFIGQGLGRYFLAWTLERAWSFNPQRVWVHTCDLDHPAALGNYLRAGFEIYDEKVIQQPAGD